MPSINDLQRQITTAQTLQSVVKTMKVLAAVSIRQYEQAVESLAEYTQTIEMGLQVVLRENQLESSDIKNNNLENFGKSRLGAIILGSDQGMCGQFNEQIAQYALSKITPLTTAPTILTVGSRVITPLQEAGQTIESSYSMPSSLAGVVSKVQDILLQIETWRFTGQINQIILFYNQPLSNTVFEPQTLTLFPLDQKWLKQLQERSWPSRTLPIFKMEKQQLFSALVQQYFFIWLYQAIAASLASENASRLTSMQLAQKNIEERLFSLNDQFQQERQTTITQEILEIVAGCEALIPS
ncbi:MAG TPA: F0F1 ATP synthase subunit gamma [Cyanothece sp. UBA12306]|nr:F0F1 ATP synthase subunit gamma [Cyanothece sp. UBA12306]